MRQNERRRIRNRIVHTRARTLVKSANMAMTSGDVAAAEQATLQAIRALDRAAQKGIVKKNNAARRKARLMKKLNALRVAKK
jgi:small subunit ribosomal protein S20